MFFGSKSFWNWQKEANGDCSSILFGLANQCTDNVDSSTCIHAIITWNVNFEMFSLELFSVVHRDTHACIIYIPFYYLQILQYYNVQPLQIVHTHSNGKIARLRAKVENINFTWYTGLQLCVCVDWLFNSRFQNNSIDRLLANRTRLAFVEQLFSSRMKGTDMTNTHTCVFYIVQATLIVDSAPLVKYSLSYYSMSTTQVSLLN